MKSLRQFLTPLLLMLLAFAQNARPPELFPVHILRVARANIAEHLRESQLTGNNLASLYSAKASLAGVLCDFHQTLRAYQLAIDIGTRGFGPRSITEGVVYALRAQVHDYIGEHTQAIADYRHALSLLKEAPGRYTPAYLTVHLAYCRSLRKAGLTQKDLCPEKA
jgi:tetratricopeptide (TPR) repeat protein